MKIGIIRCGSYSDHCPASNCLKAVREQSGQFAQYDEPVLVGLDSCGGCDRGKADKIRAKAEGLLKAGAEVIHLGNCMVGPCPYQDTFAEAIRAAGINVVKGTH